MEDDFGGGFGSLGGLGGGGGGDLVAARSSAETSINYGGGEALPQWVLVAVLAGVGLFAFVGLLLIVKKL
jgi:hypothetical protein